MGDSDGGTQKKQVSDNQSGQHGRRYTPRNGPPPLPPGGTRASRRWLGFVLFGLLGVCACGGCLTIFTTRWATFDHPDSVAYMNGDLPFESPRLDSYRIGNVLVLGAIQSHDVHYKGNVTIRLMLFSQEPDHTVRLVRARLESRDGTQFQRLDTTVPVNRFDYIANTYGASIDLFNLDYTPRGRPHVTVSFDTANGMQDVAFLFRRKTHFAPITR